MSLWCRLGLHVRYKSALHWRCMDCRGAWVKRTYSRSVLSRWRRVA
jgi:hypothetical protein